MNGKDILLDALQCKATPRTPWVPFVGVHGGALIGKDAQEFLNSTEAIVDGLKIAKEKYQADGLPVAFDLQLEAEILGCKLAWAKETPPSVASHPLDEDYDMHSLPEFSVSKGRMPIVLDAVKQLSQDFNDETALYGLLTGPLTLALHLRGDDVLLDMYDEEEDAFALFDYCADIAIKVAEAYIDAGADVIAIVDPMVSQIGPKHYTDHIAPRLNRIFDAIREKKALSSLFVCGNATRNIEAMCQTKCDNISIDENVDMAMLAKSATAAGKSFGGNMQLTTVLLLGDEQDSQRDVLRCLDLSEQAPGFVLAPGCDLPYAAKPANLEIVAKMVHDPYQVEIARSLPAKDTNDAFDDIVLPDYDDKSKVIIDVVTLDSAGCAPCAYMLKAAQTAAEQAEVETEVVEHKITGRDGLGYMTKLGVAAIPSICVAGKPTFASIIPERKELVDAIENAAKELTA